MDKFTEQQLSKEEIRMTNKQRGSKRQTEKRGGRENWSRDAK